MTRRTRIGPVRYLIALLMPVAVLAAAVLAVPTLLFAANLLSTGGNPGTARAVASERFPWAPGMLASQPPGTVHGLTGGSWESGPGMPVALGEVAGGIIGRKLYLVGEGNPTTLSYDLSTGTWSNTTALSRRPYPGHHHAAEVVGGKLYLLGGLGSGSGKVQIYDPATDTWSLGADMPFAAGSSSSAVMAGKIYVAGGIIGSSTTTQAARYDPGTNRWTRLAPMKQGRNHAAAATDGTRMYVIGGRGPGSGDGNVVDNGFDTVQIYDPRTDRWVSSNESGSTLRPLPQARGGMGKAVYYNGELYVIGGETASGAGATATNVYDRVDIYNPQRNAWRLGTPMPTARHGIFPLRDGTRIYVAGGGTHAGYSSSSVLEVYTPDQGTAPPSGVQRINAGGGGYADARGAAWAADTGYSGGSTFQTPDPIAGTVDDALYRTERWGAFAYRLAAPNGTYRVTLKFAEIYWDEPGERVFDVSVEGRTVLDNFDILRYVGPDTALDRSIVVGVSDGSLDIVFAGVVDNATIAAIEAVRDTTPPRAVQPQVRLLSPATLSSASIPAAVPVRLSWSASDPGGTGVTGYQLQRSTDGGAWAGVRLPTPGSRVTTLALTEGRSYRFRVRARDRAGNWSAWAVGPTIGVRARQETSGAVAYAGAWTRLALNGSYGGHVMASSARGAKASFRFTGRSVAWVSTVGGNRGKAEVWIDGVRVRTVDLYSSAVRTRRVVYAHAWGSTGDHTIEVRVSGAKNDASTGKRVDVDAFVILR